MKLCRSWKKCLWWLYLNCKYFCPLPSLRAFSDDLVRGFLDMPWTDIICLVSRTHPIYPSTPPPISGETSFGPVGSTSSQFPSSPMIHPWLVKPLNCVNEGWDSHLLILIRHNSYTSSLMLSIKNNKALFSVKHTVLYHQSFGDILVLII